MKSISLSDRRTKKLLFTLLVSLVLMVLSGCDALDSIDSILGLPIMQSAAATTPTPMAALEAEETSTEATPEIEVITATDGDENFELVLWVPPFVGPTDNGSAAAIFEEHIDAFENNHEGVTVDVRVKAEDGPASLMNSLTSTSAAAPLAMPSLILLSRSDLEAAAQKGLILPVADYSVVINDLDWFQYARSMAIIGDSAYGLPFAGDAMVMLSRTDSYEEGFPESWQEQFESQTPVYFEASDPKANLLLTYYLSLGGVFHDEEEQAILEPEILAQVLQIFQDGLAANTFAAEYLSLDSGALLEAYQEGTVNTVITWSSDYLGHNLESTEIHPLLPLTGYDYTVADGWILALADPLPERRALAVELAEFLVEIDFLADWNEAAGYLPMRSSSIELREDSELVKTLSLISHSAHSYPDLKTMEKIAPVLTQALVEVLEQGIDAETAAQNAATALEGLEE